MKTVLLTTADPERLSWASMQEIVPALERAWRAAVPGIVEAALDGPAWPRALWACRDADAIVVPFLTDAGAQRLRALRRDFKAPRRLILHEHGETTKGGYASLGDALRETDLIVAASEAARRCARLCYPRLRAAVVPFPLVDGETKRTRAARSARPALAYVGRISTQKNLHTLLFAYRALRDRLGPAAPALEIFGAEDSLGSPNMGFSGRGYGASLRALERALGLPGTVRWRGRKSRAWLHRWADRREHVFVSASLHSDEDFGASALASLARGRLAVLSDWGGHRDLGRAFARQTRLVPVRGGPDGPWVSPLELAAALAHALDSGRQARRPDTRPFRLEAARRALRALWREPARGDSGRPADPSALLLRLRRRLERGERALYRGYGDPLARPFLRAYGMGAATTKHPGLTPFFSCSRSARRPR